MADFNYVSSISRESHALVINSVEIPGIRSVSMSYSNPASILKYLGMKNPSFIYNGQKVGKVDIASSLITQDYFFNLFRAQLNGGLFLKNTTDGICFSTAYITSYSNSYGFGGPPDINVSLVAFSELGKSSSTDLLIQVSVIGTTDPRIKFIGPGSIVFNNSIFDTNRVQGYSIDITVNPIPIYPLGYSTPSEVQISLPLEISCSFDLEINDYRPNSINDFPKKQVIQDFNVQINDYFTQENIATYPFSQMLLVGETLISNIDNNFRVKLDYKSLSN